MAAEGYARVSGRMGVINVTTGPGGINALNGVFGAWTDSIPMLIISGQVKRETALYKHNLIGNYANWAIRKPTSWAWSRDHEIRCDRRRSGDDPLSPGTRPASGHRRPAGPCWLDIPVDVQAALVEPAALRGYAPAEDVSPASPVEKTPGHVP